MNSWKIGQRRSVSRSNSGNRSAAASDSIVAVITTWSVLAFPSAPPTSTADVQAMCPSAVAMSCEPDGVRR